MRMFQGVEQIEGAEDAPTRDGLRRVGWAELAAAISLSRALRDGEDGLLARAGPSFDLTETKDEYGVNPSSLARRKAHGDKRVPSAGIPPRRHREKR